LLILLIPLSPKNILSLGIIDYGIGVSYERIVAPQMGAVLLLKGYYNDCEPCGNYQIDDTAWYAAGLGARYYFKPGAPQGWVLGLQMSQEQIREYLVYQYGSHTAAENDDGNMFITAMLLSYRWIFFGHWVVEPSLGAGIWYLESGYKTYSGTALAENIDLLGTIELKTGLAF
jgi:hypothetical protein